MISLSGQSILINTLQWVCITLTDTYGAVFYYIILHTIIVHQYTAYLEDGPK